MFNCFVVIFAGSPFAYFRTESAAENSVALFITHFNNDEKSYKIEGRYIEGIGF